MFAQSLDVEQARIEKELGRPFNDVVRLNYWSVFERGDEFAAGEIAARAEDHDGAGFDRTFSRVKSAAEQFIQMCGFVHTSGTLAKSVGQFNPSSARDK